MLKEQILEIIYLLIEELNADEPDTDDCIRLKLGALIGLSEEEVPKMV